MIASINAFRASHGLAPLAMNANLTSKARAWAAHMAFGGCGMSNGAPSICHSRLADGISVYWSMLEENVGMINPGTNVSNMTLNSNGTIRALNGYTEITGAQPDERQVRLGLRVSF